MTNLAYLFDQCRDELDLPWMLAQSEALWQVERGQRTREHRAAARFVEELCSTAGLEQIERLTFPADGQTAYLDRTMPLAWDVNVGRLRVVDAPVKVDHPVVADYQRHPFHLIHGSVATAEGGVTTCLVSQEQMEAGADVRGAMVMLAPETRPMAGIVERVCELGALGLVSDHLRDRYATPDGIGWVNACTEGSHWHVRADDRPFIGFSVSPRAGDQLRAACRAGRVRVHVESDARRYIDEVDVVTAVIPSRGHDPRELWLLSHLYEPLPNDNATGCIAAIEVARTLERLFDQGRLPAPRFTLRVVLGMEMYGFAAYAHRRGEELRDQVVGAINLDSIIGETETLMNAPPTTPFCGDYVLEALSRVCAGAADLPAQQYDDEGGYSDDLLLNDPAVGVPTVWARAKAPLWHNSQQTMAMIEPGQYHASTAFRAAWVARMLTLDGPALDVQVRHAAWLAEAHLHDEATSLLERAGDRATTQADDETPSPRLARRIMVSRCRRERDRLADFSRLGSSEALGPALNRLENTSKKLLRELAHQLRHGQTEERCAERDAVHQLAATIVPVRSKVGLPHDLTEMPKRERGRRPHPRAASHILARIDGTKTLARLAREAALTERRQPKADQLRRWIGVVERLKKYGYLDAHFKQCLTQSDIVAALRRVGLREGDVMLLHTGLAALGHVEGGADAVIGACLEVIGPGGTLLAPVFSHTEVAGTTGEQARKDFRPYHPQRSMPWTGQVPTRLLDYANVVRSAHPTHSVAGLGPLASACVGAHGESDAPFGDRSPLARMLEHDTKMVWLGADLAATTYFHRLETALAIPVMGHVLCRVERPDGRVETVHVPGYPGGHRDFYRKPGEAAKLYQRLINDGLEIRRAPVGFGEVKLIETRAMHDHGVTALSEKPDLLLCDRPTCAFCQLRHGIGAEPIHA